MVTSNMFTTPMVDTFSDNTIELNQGRPYSQVKTIGINMPATNLSVKAYPNPVTNQVILQMDALLIGEMDVRIYNVKGEELQVPVEKKKGAIFCEFALDFHRHGNGIYFLCFEKMSRQQLKTIKVQKVC